MRIDYGYVASILETFLNGGKPALHTDHFQSHIDEDGNKFFFHLILLNEQNIIRSALTKGNGVGVSYNFRNEDYDYAVIPLRLTAYGHDFANALSKPNILETIQTKFKDEGLSVVVDVAKSIVSKKAEALLGE